MDRLVQAAETGPTAEARAMAVKDSCLAASAAADAAVLTRLNCENGVLKALVGEL